MKVIFTNGCFDILHRGHIELLQFCRALGDKVVVGLNSDASIRKLKGTLRPINSQKDRALLLSSLRFVDEVIIFDEETPERLIGDIRPDILVKGGDYELQDIIGNTMTKVVIFNYIKGYSTTETIKRLQDLPPPSTC